MPALKNTEIYRGGVTASYLSFETSKCRFQANPEKDDFEFRFSIDSKGGGQTSILVRVGSKDLPLILQEIASKVPESIDALSEGVVAASKRNLEILNEQRDQRENDEKKVGAVVQKLGRVSGYINKQYLAAPVGEDEEESEMESLIEDAIESLKNNF